MLFDESAKTLNSDGLINLDDDWNLALLYELVETKFSTEQQKVAERQVLDTIVAETTNEFLAAEGGPGNAKAQRSKIFDAISSRMQKDMVVIPGLQEESENLSTLIKNAIDVKILAENQKSSARAEFDNLVEEISNNLSPTAKLEMPTASRRVILDMVQDKLTSAGQTSVSQKEIGNTVGVVAAKIQNDQKIAKNKDIERIIYQALAKKLLPHSPKTKVLRSELDQIFTLVSSQLSSQALLHKDENSKQDLLSKITSVIEKNWGWENSPTSQTLPSNPQILPPTITSALTSHKLSNKE